MRITDDIKTAIRHYLEKTGKNNAELGKLVGVSMSAVGNWLNGKASDIRNRNWAKLHPLIEPYWPTTIGSVVGGEADIDSLAVDRLPAASQDANAYAVTTMLGAMENKVKELERKLCDAETSCVSLAAATSLQRRIIQDVLLIPDDQLFPVLSAIYHVRYPSKEVDPTAKEVAEAAAEQERRRRKLAEKTK